MSSELDERACDVLRAVVKEFISTGEPVGSLELTRRGDFDVSPATMRGVLAELEELGYLEKPHTSSGRVPTDLGYRFFVDALLQLKVPAPKDRELIEQGLSQVTTVEQRLQEAGRVLHLFTRHAAVVMTPRPQSLVPQHLDFVRLREGRILAVLVGRGGTVQNRLLAVDFSLTSEDLVRAANHVNQLFQEGLPIEAVRERILAELETERAQYDALAATALKLGALATEVTAQERVLIEGQGSFLDQREFTENVQRMRALFQALDDKHKLLQLLDRVQRAREVQIFIGAESDFSAQGEVAVVASPYGRGDQVLGTLGVIGPTRMNYQRIIPLVTFTAQALSRALQDD